MIELVEQCVHSVHLASAVFVPTSINLVPKELLQQRFDSMTTTSEPPTESVRPRSRSPLRKVEHCIVIDIESPAKKESEPDQRLEDSQTPPHWRSDWDPDEDYFVYRQIQQNFMPEARFRSVSTGDVSDRMAELRKIYRQPQVKSETES